ncbi:AAA family ATPase [Williamsia maris]|uniref:Nicotinamide-nucleotide adenylyltransferase, NadR type n=1 Tax=Williamsia maris TaxID=72806 RepID=A0ABT1H962_9NOCA|nr:AAA family ATPase [Williamsia maris]MCP2174808.1 nicotinamide-nucleotide adenylyltransferase, NadR type [Williamsia maris]
MYRHALVIGKFYPPHAGHHALIRYAATVSEKVTVVAMSSAAESIPLDDRVGWLRESHSDDPSVQITGIVCDAPVDLGSRAVWAAQVACMRAAVAQVSPDFVDAVVSSESYGPHLATWFDAAHVSFDPERQRVPISGTRCRARLADSWTYLDAPARVGLTTRLVALGSESTGTTTVSLAVAQHFRDRGGIWESTQWVPEYGRDATASKLSRLQTTSPDADMNDVTWTGDDFAHIARTQQVREDAAARDGSPLLVCDTDAFATTVWERRYLGPHSHRATSEARDTGSIYLITDHEDVPFVQDGIRDGEHIRAEMTGWFIDALTRSGRSWVWLTGSLDERIALAVRVADQSLATRSTFADPLGMS